MKVQKAVKKEVSGKILNFTDRVIILMILPLEGSKVNMLLNRDLRKKIEITQKEKTDSTMVHIGKNLQWDITKDKGVFIPLSEIEIAVISETFKKLDAAEKLKEQWIDTMDKFC